MTDSPRARRAAGGRLGRRGGRGGGGLGLGEVRQMERVYIFRTSRIWYAIVDVLKTA